MAYTKPGSPFLYDEVTNDVVGFKDRDTSEQFLAQVSGGSAALVTAAVAKLGRAQMTVGALGNSISADPLRFWELAALKSNGSLVVTKNASVAGNTTAQIKARMATDWPVGSGNLCFHQEGTNDFDAGTSPAVSYAVHSQNVRDIFNYLLSVGTVPIGVFPPPRDSSPTGLARMGLCDYVVAREFGIPFIFPWRQFVNPTTGALTSAAGSADGIHPARSAHELAAVDAISQLQDGAIVPLLPLSNVDGAGQRTSNVVFLTDSNADGLADGIISYGDANVVNSLSAVASPGVGNWQVMQANGTGLHIWEYPIPATGFQVGDTVMLVMRLKIEMLAANAVCTVQFKWWAGGTEYYGTLITPGSNTTPVSECVVVKEVIVPAAITQAQVSVSTNIASCRCSIAQLQAYNLTGATR